MGFKRTLCWSCGNACGGCSWSRSSVPVAGWTAMPTRISSMRIVSMRDSYLVQACPQYRAERRRRRCD